jgi:hypothetical protein
MQVDTLDDDLYSMIGYYGFKKIHKRLIEIMKEEYTYLHSQFQVQAQVVIPSTPHVEQPKAEQPHVEQENKRKVRKQRVKKDVKKVEDVNESNLPDNTIQSYQPDPEIKEVVLVPPQDKSGYRDPKEWKEYQKKAEELKHRENESLGIQVHTILTRENLKKWVEEEGQSYAWVAREKAGCPDTQVAATAQMMGIRSKVTKKRGMILSGK